MHLLPLAEHWDPGPWFLVFPLFWLTVFALFWVLLARRFGGRRGRGGAREIPAERVARGEFLQAVIAFDGRLRSGLSDDAVAQLRTQLGRLAQNVRADSRAPATIPGVELGLYTFAERTPDPLTGELVTAEQRLRDLLEEVELAEAVGLDVFGVGEHHRPDFVVSSPAVVLAAAAARTERLRLTSAVNVLSSDDPVRVFQDFATLDLISGGRAEIMVGRGSFIESFPLFGYDLADYDVLFAEKLALLLRIREGERVTWRGGHRPPIDDLGVYPRPVQEPLPVWVAVGGTPESAVRAGTLGLPMALGIIGGLPERFVPFAELHRRAAAEAGHDPPRLSINSHGYVADTHEAAVEESFPAISAMMNAIGRERGWPPLSRTDYEASTTRRGANFVGTPQEVADKILFQRELFGHDRFLVQFGVGTMPHDRVLRSIELFGTEVAPRVREALGRR